LERDAKNRGWHVNYRAARVIALKNKERQVNTEELRQAMINYRSLFEELLETEAVAS
jgi:hypothetical protein